MSIEVITLLVVKALLILFIMYREYYHTHITSKLIDKLMSRDYKEYHTITSKKPTLEKPKTKLKRAVDPILGSTY